MFANDRVSSACWSRKFWSTMTPSSFATRSPRSGRTRRPAASRHRPNGNPSRTTKITFCVQGVMPAPCGGSPVSLSPLVALEDAGLEPHPDQPEDARIDDTAAQCLHRLVVLDGIERRHHRLPITERFRPCGYPPPALLRGAAAGGHWRPESQSGPAGASGAARRQPNTGPGGVDRLDGVGGWRSRARGRSRRHGPRFCRRLTQVVRDH
jgi:hypothetical protein